MLNLSLSCHSHLSASVSIKFCLQTEGSALLLAFHTFCWRLFMGKVRHNPALGAVITREALWCGWSIFGNRIRICFNPGCQISRHNESVMDVGQVLMFLFHVLWPWFSVSSITKISCSASVSAYRCCLASFCWSSWLEETWRAFFGRTDPGRWENVPARLVVDFSMTAFMFLWIG